MNVIREKRRCRKPEQLEMKEDDLNEKEAEHELKFKDLENKAQMIASRYELNGDLESRKEVISSHELEVEMKLADIAKREASVLQE